MEHEITFIVDAENKVAMKLSGAISIPDFLTTVFSATYAFLDGAVKQISEANPELSEEQIVGDIYDMFNSGAANVLDLIMPEPTNFADELTAEAIMQAENAILESKDEPEPIQMTFDDLTIEDNIVDMETHRNE